MAKIERDQHDKENPVSTCRNPSATRVTLQEAIILLVGLEPRRKQIAKARESSEDRVDQDI